MVDSALTIAFLVRDQRLRDACRLWLRDRAVTLQPLDLAADPVPQLEQLRDSFDALLLERGLLDPASIQALREAGLVFPAVVIGEVSGATDYHPSEVHLPPDQLEQLRYSIDAAISGFLRQGLQESSQSAPSGASPVDGEDRWKLANRLRERLGYLGVFYKRDPARFLRNLPESDREELTRSLEPTRRWKVS
jgi:circadian clock protein KaiA